MREIVLGSNDSGKKLENYLKKAFPIGYVRKLFRKNGIRLNGQRANPQDALRAGDKIQLYIPFEKDAPRNQPNAPTQKLAIVFEDPNLLVIDKPAGMAVHEGRTVSKRESVLGILEQQYRDSQIKPQLVHRLDQYTSGLLLVAKNLRAADELEQAFETGAVDKEYCALVVGRLANDQGKIDTPLPGRDGNPVRALTRYRVGSHHEEIGWLVIVGSREPLRGFRLNEQRGRGRDSFLAAHELIISFSSLAVVSSNRENVLIMYRRGKCAELCGFFLGGAWILFERIRHFGSNPLPD